jgi:hypothetical protein
MAGRLKVGLKGDVHVAKIARGSHFAVRGWMVYCLLAGSSLTLAACGRQGTEPQEATRQTKVVASLKLKEPKDHQDSRSLAYEHTVSIELPKDLISARINDVRVACDSRKEFACTLLDVSVQEQLQLPSGQVRLRLAPKAVEPLIEVAAHGGRIIARNTHAEDLAEPIADTERELAQLSSYRDRLSQFLERKDLKVEQVISLSKEISSTQTQIESANTRKANLVRRTDTELLTFEFSPPEFSYTAQQTPIRNALRSFGIDLGQGVAQVISFVAFLLPWLVIIVPGIILLRLFWRWITRWLARRELPH